MFLVEMPCQKFLIDFNVAVKSDVQTGCIFSLPLIRYNKNPSSTPTKYGPARHHGA